MNDCVILWVEYCDKLYENESQSNGNDATPNSELKRRSITQRVWVRVQPPVDGAWEDVADSSGARGPNQLQDSPQVCHRHGHGEACKQKDRSHRVKFDVGGKHFGSFAMSERCVHREDAATCGVRLQRVGEYYQKAHRDPNDGDKRALGIADQHIRLHKYTGAERMNSRPEL